MGGMNAEDRTGRAPQRKRGFLRHARLLDAAAAVLERTGDSTLSLAVIAEEAGVPLPSVYHFFPNRHALLAALAARYHADLSALALAPLAPAPTRWQEIIRRRQEIGAEYLNANPAALQLFMGAGVSAEVRNLDLAGNASLATVRAREFRAHFDCSALPRLDYWLGVSIGLMDGIWAVSWTHHRRIGPDYLNESVGAVVAYLRLHLPESLPARKIVE